MPVGHDVILRKFQPALEPLLLRALAIRKQAFGAEYSQMAVTLEGYAVVLRNTRRKLEAAAVAAGSGD